jgi:hypothetical protein
MYPPTRLFLSFYFIFLFICIGPPIKKRYPRNPRSSGMLRSIDLYLVTDVSGENIDSIFKGQALFNGLSTPSLSLCFLLYLFIYHKQYMHSSAGHMQYSFSSKSALSLQYFSYFINILVADVNDELSQVANTLLGLIFFVSFFSPAVQCRYSHPEIGHSSSLSLYSKLVETIN